MQRRSFLRAISSIVPAAGLQEILVRQVEAQSAAPTTSSGLHVVGAGNDRLGQPHALGFSSSLLFKVAGSALSSPAAPRFTSISIRRNGSM